VLEARGLTKVYRMGEVEVRRRGPRGGGGLGQLEERQALSDRKVQHGRANRAGAGCTGEVTLHLAKGQSGPGKTSMLRVDSARRGRPGRAGRESVAVLAWGAIPGGAAPHAVHLPIRTSAFVRGY
jgi:hypothetical protein